MTKFHTEEYIEFLREISPDNMQQQNMVARMKEHNVGYPIANSTLEALWMEQHA